MKLRKMVTTAIVITCAGCTVHVPSTLTLKDSVHRSINNEVARTDAGTALRCAENMLNSSPADSAESIAYTMNGTGDNATVNVDATLINVGLWKSPLPVSYRCVYVNGIMTNGKFTKGL